MHAQDPEPGVNYYDQSAALDLDLDDIDAALTDDLTVAENDLMSTFSDYAPLPRKAKEGLLDMTLNCSITGGLKRKRLHP
jgi:hypothetical protein